MHPPAGRCFRQTLTIAPNLVESMTMKRISAICLLALCPALGLASIVPAAGIVTGSGPYVWTYSLQLSADAGANAGQAWTENPAPPADADAGGFFTIYGFAGYVAGSCAGPAAWACTVQSAVDASANAAATDDADAVNLTWAYVGGPVLGGLPSGRSLGDFSAQSRYDTAGALSFAARAVTNNSGRAGSMSNGAGQTAGPVAAASASTAGTAGTADIADTADIEFLAVNGVPEPDSLALAGLGLAALGFARRGTRRRQST